MAAGGGGFVHRTAKVVPVTRAEGEPAGKRLGIKARVFFGFFLERNLLAGEAAACEILVGFTFGNAFAGFV